MHRNLVLPSGLAVLLVSGLVKADPPFQAPVEVWTVNGHFGESRSGHTHRGIELLNDESEPPTRYGGDVFCSGVQGGIWNAGDHG